MHEVLKVTMVPLVVTVTIFRSTSTTENECISNSKYQPLPTSPSQDSESRFHKRKSPQNKTCSSANSPQSSMHMRVKRYTFTKELPQRF